MNGRNSLSLKKAINPETGEEDLIGAIRYVIRRCNGEPYLENRDIREKIKIKISHGYAYHVIEGGMTERLESLGISRAYLAEFLLLMQILRVCVKVKAGKFWKIIDEDVIDEFIDEVSVNDTLEKLLKHRNRIDLIRQQAKRIEYLESIIQEQEGDEDTNEKEDVDFPDDLLEEATSALLLANNKIDHLAKENSEKDQQLISLQEMVEGLREELISKSRSEKDLSEFKSLINQTLNKCN